MLTPSTPVLYVFDFLLTLPEEVSEIWPTKWSLPKAAFFLSRYGGLALFLLDAVTSIMAIDSALVKFFPSRFDIRDHS